MLDGPLPVKPPRSLLNVEGVLQETPADDHWMNGVHLWGYPEGQPLTWDPCGVGTYETKSDESSFSTPMFAAFVAYLPITCSSFSLASDPEGFARRAEIALDAIISFAVEKALSQGVVGLDNPSLTTLGITSVPGGTASLTPATGMAWLEDAIGETARAGMIHLTPPVASVVFDNTGWDPPGLYTPLGTPVAAGGGYKGATPAGQAAAAAGQSWVFATGPVRAFIANETMLNIKDVLDRTDNDVTFRAERYVLVEWDTALSAAVLIDWTP